MSVPNRIAEMGAAAFTLPAHPRHRRGWWAQVCEWCRGMVPEILARYSFRPPAQIRGNLPFTPALSRRERVFKAGGLNGYLTRGTVRIPEGAVPPGLIWVDEFISRIRAYVEVRQDDQLLIRMPNQAYKLNREGAAVMQFLLEGGTIGEWLRTFPARTEARQALGLFLFEVRRCLAGELRESCASDAVEIRPLTLDFSTLPVLSEVALTARCNLRCIFCYAGCAGSAGTKRLNGQGPASPRQRRLTTAEVESLLTRIRHEARVPSVSFTGGEPCLRKDLEHLVAFAVQQLGMRVNLITNGTLMTAERAQRLAAAGLASAQVSIEGPDATTHDAITQVPGSFARSCQAVHHFAAAGVYVHCNTTLNRRNLAFATAMPEFARNELGLERLSMNMVIPAGSAELSPEHAEATLLRYAEIGPVVLAVQGAAERVGVEFMWYSPTPLCLFNPILANLGNKGCSACDGLLSIAADGQILPCSSYPQPIGSLLETPFADLWQSAAARNVRGKGEAPPGCSDCEHFAFCHGACPLYWHHFGYAELAAVRPQTYPVSPPDQIGDNLPLTPAPSRRERASKAEGLNGYPQTADDRSALP